MTQGTITTPPPGPHCTWTFIPIRDSSGNIIGQEIVSVYFDATEGDSINVNMNEPVFWFNATASGQIGVFRTQINHVKGETGTEP